MTTQRQAIIDDLAQRYIEVCGERDELRAKVERLWAGMEQIRDASGHACGEMETCAHKGCDGSIAAHLIALELLHLPTEKG